jgi:hypothetical protein
MGLMSGFRLLRLSRCRACEPRCPNGHELERTFLMGAIYASAHNGMWAVLALL